MWLKFFAQHCGDLGWALGPRCYQFNQLWKLVKNQPGTGHPITGPKIIHDCKKFMGQLTDVIKWWPILASGYAHEMVQESVLPLVFLKHPEYLHPPQAKNFPKGACEGAC